MRKDMLVFLAAILIASGSAQSCLDGNGNEVSWWVQLIYPGSVKGGFAYFDNQFQESPFEVHSEPADSPETPMTRTFTQINTQKLQSIAWNDEQPKGRTSSSKAHSKGVLAFNDPSSGTGFFIVHSLPKFPAFNGFTISTKIDDSETIYGQHVFCLSLKKGMFGDLMTKISPIKPYIYAQNLKKPYTLKSLFKSGILKPSNFKDLFTYQNYKIDGTQMRFIFKNGKLHGKIFEDGLTNMLKSSIMAETWGRPIQAPWCTNNYNVENVRIVQIDSKTKWKETLDHSKWAYAEDNNFVCFGDMNRMKSQWKRGGAFYCVNSPLLKSAMKSITGKTQACH